MARIGRFSGAQVLFVVATVVLGAVIAVVTYERDRASFGADAQEEVGKLTAVSSGEQDDASTEPDRVQHHREVLHESLGDQIRIGPVSTLASAPVRSDSSIEGSPEDELRSRAMEQRILSNFARTSITFTSIEHVTCAWPTCEIQYTTAGQPSPGIMGELLALFGKDDRGDLILKSASQSLREIYPGTQVPILTLTFESP